MVVGNDLYVPNEIYHTGDTDTSIRFPAEDQFRVMTGGGNRLQVENTKILVGDDVNMQYDNISTSNSGTVVYGTYQFPVPMRAAPTYAVTNISSFKMRFGADTTSTSSSYHGTASSHTITPVFYATGTTFTAGRHGWVEAIGGAKLSFDAEL